MEVVMRFLMKVSIPVEAGNAFLASKPDFGQILSEILESQRAESVFFTAYGGQRTLFYVVNIENNAQMPAIAEPWWFLANASVEFLPAMTPDDLAKAAPDVTNAAKKYGD
jgi:hypothetical protein